MPWIPYIVRLGRKNLDFAIFFEVATHATIGHCKISRIMCRDYIRVEPLAHDHAEQAHTRLRRPSAPLLHCVCAAAPMDCVGRGCS